MEQVIRTYGKFLLEAAIFAAVMLLLFKGIADEQGNRGVLRMAGAALKDGETVSARMDIEAYWDESKRSAPAITYVADRALYTGEYTPEELFEAKDDRGSTLSLRVRSICDPHGEKREYSTERESIRFDERGIYTICVSATDTWNRTCVCEFRIPVNSQEGIY